MVEAPEKIWAAATPYSVEIAYAIKPPKQYLVGYTEYLRADIAERQIAELRAEVERIHELYGFEQRGRLAAEAENARLRALPLKDEVERVLRKARDETMGEAGVALLDKSVDGRVKANWLGGKANGLATALDILSRLRAGEQEGCRLIGSDDAKLIQTALEHASFALDGIVALDDEDMGKDGGSATAQHTKRTVDRALEALRALQSQEAGNEG